MLLVVLEDPWESHGTGYAMVYFPLFAVEALSVLRLILVVSPLIMLHLHGRNAESAPPLPYKQAHHMHHAITYV